MNDFLSEEMKRERDVRLYGVEAANHIAQLRKLVEENRRLIQLSVSRESSRGNEPDVTASGSLILGNPRPQGSPSTIHGADKPLTKNAKDPASYL